MDDTGLRGNLEDVNFPELLQKVSQRKETGVLQITHLKVKKAIYFQEGEIVFAKSNDADDRLGELLLRKGKLTWRQLEDSARKIVPGKRLGTILVQEGHIKPNDLYHGVIDQVEEIIYSLFEWQVGEFDFIPGELPGEEDITLSISSPDVIATGIRRVWRWSWVRKGILSLDQIFCRTDDWPSIAKRMSKTPEVKTLIQLMEQPMTTEQILRASTTTNFETCKLIWALLVVGIIDRFVPGLGAGLGPVDPSVEDTMPFGIEPPEEKLPAMGDAFGANVEPPLIQDVMFNAQKPVPSTPPPPPAPAPKAAPVAARPPMPVIEVAAPAPPPKSTPEPIPLIPVEAPIPSSMDFSFSDLTDLTDEGDTVEPPAPEASDNQGWEQKVPAAVQNFNERQRFLFERIRIEVGPNVSNFVAKILKKAQGKYPLIFEGAPLNEFGEFEQEPLVGNIQGNLAENYGEALDFLLKEELSTISSILDRKRAEAIEAGYARIVEKQKAQ